MGRVLCLVIGYVFGLFQTGYLYGKMNHIDIRNYGSGNSGTTNALRVLGKKAGLIVFAGDFLKTVFACLAARIIFKASPIQTSTCSMQVSELSLDIISRAICTLKAEKGSHPWRGSSCPWTGA